MQNHFGALGIENFKQQGDKTRINKLINNQNETVIKYNSN